MIYSKHAQARLKERFPEFMINQSTLVSIDAAFKAAEPSKRFINNTAFLVEMMERYGDFNYEFYVNGDAVFVCTNNMMMTVMRLNGSKKKSLHAAKCSRFKKKFA